MIIVHQCVLSSNWAICCLHRGSAILSIPPARASAPQSWQGPLKRLEPGWNRNSGFENGQVDVDSGQTEKTSSEQQFSGCGPWAAQLQGTH